MRKIAKATLLLCLLAMPAFAGTVMTQGQPCTCKCVPMPGGYQICICICPVGIP
jgi:hypothetical protein